jgi:glutathione S-transferase
MKLYQNPISHNCRRATIVAAHLGLPVELEAVDVTKGENKTPEYLADNPNGMIPTLVDGDFTLWESRAIMQYLAAKKPEAGLLGANERERADVTRWLLWDASHLNRHVGAIMFEKVVKGLFKMGPPDEAVIKTAQEQVKRFYGVLETCLAGKTYLVGERLTIADLSVACAFTFADMVGVPLGDFPNIKAWLARISALDAWKKTQPQLPAAAE